MEASSDLSCAFEAVSIYINEKKQNNIKYLVSGQKLRLGSDNKKFSIAN